MMPWGATNEAGLLEPLRLMTQRITPSVFMGVTIAIL